MIISDGKEYQNGWNVVTGDLSLSRSEVLVASRHFEVMQGCGNPNILTMLAGS